jgi:NAD(P)H-hydrate epimerase
MPSLNQIWHYGEFSIRGKNLLDKINLSLTLQPITVYHKLANFAVLFLICNLVELISENQIIQPKNYGEYVMTRYPIYTGNIPYLTTAQMIEVDRAMIEDYKITLMQMMENAGRNLAHLARDRFFDGTTLNKSVVILAGTGGNGGGALVCARRLHNYGANIHVYVTKPMQDFTPIPQHQFDILQRMGVPIQPASAIDQHPSADLIIDGLIGYSLKGSPRSKVSKLIHWANGSNTPILALDTPSGIDTTTGKVFSPTIRATATMTLALPKAGLLSVDVTPFVGELYLADISVPPQLYSKPELALNVPPIFATNDIIRIL